MTWNLTIHRICEKLLQQTLKVTVPIESWGATTCVVFCLVSNEIRWNKNPFNKYNRIIGQMSLESKYINCIPSKPWLDSFLLCFSFCFDVDISENNDTHKSAILIGFSIINHPFWGIPIFGNTHVVVKHIAFEASGCCGGCCGCGGCGCGGCGGSACGCGGCGACSGCVSVASYKGEGWVEGRSDFEKA